MDYVEVPPLSRPLRLSLVVLVAWAVLLTGAPGFAVEAAPAQDAATQPTPAPRDPLLIDNAPATKASARSTARKWTQSRIYYYETIPSKWDWSLSKAVSKWNASGGGIKLTRTIHPSKAKVRISYGNIGHAAGQATIGSTSKAFVRLSSRYAAASVDSADAYRRIEVMAIFTHELGHVLGFGHTTAKCSLMRSVLDVSGCHIPPTSPPGYHKCRTIDAALVRSFVRMYGGRARLPAATWCLIDPMPSALTGVRFSGGVDSPVTVSWAKPTTVPTGSTVEIRMWPGAACTTAPSWADSVHVSPTALQWRDDQARTRSTHCFQARLVNRFGAGRTAVLRLMARWMQPPTAPVILTRTWDSAAAALIVTESHPEGTYLKAQWDITAPSHCPEAYVPGGPGTLEVSGEEGSHSLQLPVGAVCVSFFTWDAATDSYSPATQESFPAGFFEG